MTNKAAIVVGIVAIIVLAVGLPYAFKGYRAEEAAPQPAPSVGTPAPSQAPNAFSPESPVAPPQTPPATQAPSAPVPTPTPPPPPPSTPPPGAPSAISAAISGFAFSPASLTVKKGTTVTWTNEDNAGHTVTGDSGGPSSGLFSQGQKYSFTFDTVGTFPYHCAPHPFMKGTVTVTE